MPARLRAVEFAVVEFARTGVTSPVERRQPSQPRRGQDDICRGCGMKGGATLRDVSSGMCVHPMLAITLWLSTHIEDREEAL